MQNNTFHIEGGVPLHGSIAASGNKNAALPLIALSIMLDGPLALSNLPRIGDVNIMLTMLEEMGASTKYDGDNAVILNASNIKPPEIDNELSSRLRGSVLLAAPLLARFGKVKMPFPGGDRIGRRRLDTHLLALQSMGASIDINSEGYTILCKGRLKGADILLDEASVTATENTVMAAALAEGQTIIYNAACEPHVQDLCRTMVAAGALIDGIGTNRLVINGVKTLSGAEIKIGADMIEVGSLIVLTALTGGDVTITNTNPSDLRMILLQLQRLGITVEISGSDVHVPPNQALEIEPDLRGAVPKIEDSPWPGFPADLTSIAVVAASQAKGSVMVFEKMFESRLFFVDQLINMGARIVLCDPHRAVVIGPSPLYARPIISPDIRAGMALLIAALTAKGVSVMRNIDQIDRGYENIDKRLIALGAKITRD